MSSLRSARDAKKALAESIKKVQSKLEACRSRMGPNSGLEPVSSLAKVVSEGLAEVNRAQAEAWDSIDLNNDNVTAALEGVQVAQNSLQMQAGDMQATASVAAEAKETANKNAGKLDRVARVASANLSKHQERQLAESHLNIVIKGIPCRTVAGEKKERYRDLIVAFQRAMAELNLQGEITPKTLRRMTKRSNDLSLRPPHLKVELSVIGHKLMIHDALADMKKKGKVPSFLVTSDIPQYALKRHDSLQRISQYARQANPDLKTRVNMRNRKWPELQMLKSDGEWVGMPMSIFEPARLQHNKRIQADKERKAAVRREKAPSKPVIHMETDQAFGEYRTQKPKESTSRQTRSKGNKTDE